VFSTQNKYKDGNKRIALIPPALNAINRPLTHPQRTKISKHTVPLWYILLKYKNSPILVIVSCNCSN